MKHLSVLFIFFLLIFLDTIQAQDCPGLSSIDLIVVAAPEPVIAGPSAFCAGTTAQLEVTEPFNQYSWSNGASTQSITVNAPGTYRVTVTNSAGCTGTEAFTLVEIPRPQPVIAAAPYNCNGNLELNAGTGFADYQWSNGETTNPITISAGGTYSVTVTDATGCTGSSSLLAVIPVPPAVNVTGPSSFCIGTTANLEATPGLSSYSWSSGQSGATIAVSAAGTYAVTAADAFGCTATASIDIATWDAPEPDIDGVQVICSGQQTVWSAPGPFISWNWSTGGTGPSTTVSAPGTYTVTVTDANGCTGTDALALTVNALPQPAINQNPYQCDGQITLDAGPGYAGYIWSNGVGGNPIAVTLNDVYGVTVTDANGCTGVTAIPVTIPPDPVVGITGDNAFCENQSALLQATGGFVTYNWSNGLTGQSISVLDGGTYAVTVTNALGCTASSSFQVSELPAPQPTTTSPGAVCDGETAILGVSEVFSSYAWSNGQNTQSIAVTLPGTYTVVVTGNNGCTGTAAASLVVNPSPQPVASADPYDCTGTISLSVSGVFPAYNWSTGETSNRITATQPGFYTVTVTESNGCTGETGVQVDIPPDPFVVISGSTQICAGSVTTLNASPGLNAYIWSTGESSSFILVDQTGNYSVTATDDFGCTATASFSVQTLPTPAPVIAGPASICGGSSATFTVQGVFSAYIWSNGQTGNAITVTDPGTYTVTVTAANGCTGTDDQVLTISNTLSPVITQEPYDCTGQVVLDAGTGFATYAWDNGATSQTIAVNASGTYTVTVTDGTGCSGSDVLSMTIPDEPVVGISGLSNICQNTQSTLSATPGFNAYAWSNNQVGPSISVGTGGVYAVTATDAFGCTATADFFLTVNPGPAVTINGPGTICLNSSGTLSATPGLSAYVWSTGANTAQITVADAGTYGLTVTDANNCTAVAAATVQVTSALQPEATALPYACDGQVTLVAEPGYASYAWSNGQNTPVVVVAQSGTYSVVVSDATGCTGTTDIAVDVPVQPVVFLSGDTAFCAGQSSLLTAVGDFPAYLWSTGDTTAMVQATATGTYTVTVTDAQGCTATSAIQVVAQPLPVVGLIAPPAICEGSQVQLQVNPDVFFARWSTGDIGNALTVSDAGVYGVTITDINGCTAADSVALQVFGNPVAQITALPYQCDARITLVAAGAQPTHTWSGGVQGDTLRVTQSGLYQLITTDANGCTSTDTLRVEVPALPELNLFTETTCPGTPIVVSAFDYSLVQYLWSTGATTSQLVVYTEGLYSITATDAYGCTVSKSITLFYFPGAEPVIQGPLTVCEGSTATLSLSTVFSFYRWSNGSTGPTIDIVPPATVSVTVTNGFLCEGVAEVTVGVSDQLTPVIIATPEPCSGTYVLDAGTGYPVYAWSNGATGQTQTVSQSGLYSVTVSDGAGCTGVAQVNIQIPDLPTVSISGPAILCPGATAVLQATSGFANYIWSNGAGTPSALAGQPGTYAVTVTDQNGCTDAAQIQVLPGTADTTRLQVQTCDPLQAGVVTQRLTGTDGCDSVVITTTTLDGSFGAEVIANTLFNGFNIPCAGGTGGSVTGVALGGQAPFTYTWSNGGVAPTLSGLSAGTYQVTITDASGCTGTAQATLTAPPEVLPVIQALGPDCAAPGRITVQSVSGGVGPYTVRIFQEIGTTTGAEVLFFDDLDEGVFTVEVTDQNGCVAGEVVVLAPVEVVNELVGDTIEVFAGTSVTLNAPITITPVDISWSAAGVDLSCTNCLSPTLTPLRTTELRLFVQGYGACAAEGTFLIRVITENNVYIPNVFAPDQSGLNDRFTVYGDERLVRIRTLQVYDRWGGKMATFVDLLPNRPEQGWDGNFQGKPMNPGVYVYWAELEYADGSTAVIQGDVTLIR